MERWIEHYSDLYARENQVSQAALDAIERLPALYDLDTTLTKEELKIAIDRLPSGKTPGKDAITAEVIKCGNTTLLDPPNQLLCLCWEEGAVPQDMRYSSIVTLYKNRGDRSICDNYWGISLLSIEGKLFAQIVICRLQKFADSIYPESQCGFMSNRPIIDMICSLRQLQRSAGNSNNLSTWHL